MGAARRVRKKGEEGLRGRVSKGRRAEERGNRTQPATDRELPRVRADDDDYGPRRAAQHLIGRG